MKSPLKVFVCFLMSQEIRQTVKTEQGLAITPQLKRSLDILQAPALEVEKIIENEIRTNPLLEEVPNEPNPAPEMLGDGGEHEDFESSEEKVPAIPKRERREGISYSGSSLDSDAQEKRDFFISSIPDKISLHEYLLNEAAIDAPTPGSQAAFKELAGFLDERGFLPGDAAELVRGKGFSESDVNAVDMASPYITIQQAGQEVGTSVDLTAHDKEVVQLQAHQTGAGVPIVLMGDGFIDTEIANGFYEEVMKQAMENLFTEEPLKELRDYFDVWMVKAVSLNNAFNDDYVTKFGCTFDSSVSTEITGDNALVEEYAKAVPELAGDAALFDEALLIVILNTESYVGTTNVGFESTAQPGYICERAIAYCPTVDGVDAERFRQVLVHEAMGHGLAKLIDEYSYEQNGEIPAYLVEQYRNNQAIGWFVNVDFTDDPEKVLWSRFLADPRYQGVDANGQTLGLYQGACSYWTGAWRPTDDSMMRHNQNGFNVPSREAIYKRVMSTAYGSGWVYDYDEFTAFDQAHLPQPTATATTKTLAPTEWKPLAAPRIVSKSLRLFRR